MTSSAPTSPQTPNTPTSREARLSGRFWGNGFIVRLLRSYLNSLDGERTSNEFFGPDTMNYHRLNIWLPKAPELDDVKSIPSMQEDTKQNVCRRSLQEIKRTIYATSFYYELHALPTVSKYGYECTGSLNCRLNDVDTLLDNLKKEPMAFFLGRKYVIS